MPPSREQSLNRVTYIHLSASHAVEMCADYRSEVTCICSSFKADYRNDSVSTAHGSTENTSPRLMNLQVQLEAKDHIDRHPHGIASSSTDLASFFRWHLTGAHPMKKADYSLTQTKHTGAAFSQADLPSSRSLSMKKESPSIPPSVEASLSRVVGYVQRIKEPAQ